MNINLSNLIESILNPNGRFRTLDGIYAVRDSDGELSMTLNELTVRFDMVWNETIYTLKCLYDTSGERRRALKEISDYTERIDCPHLVPHLYLEKEMLVFDQSETPVYIDVMLQRKPAGRRLDLCLAEAASSGDRGRIRQLLCGLSEMAEWLSANDFSHRNICTRNIYAAAAGTNLALVHYSRSSRSRSYDDLLSLGSLAAALYIAACQPELYNEIIHEKALKTQGLRKLVHIIADIMGDSDAGELEDLLSILASGAEVPADRLCGAIRRLASAHPRSYGALENIVSRLQHGNGNNRIPVPEKYPFIGKMEDMVIRVYDGTKWFYIDRHGNRAIAGDYVSAGDFSEGRAVVETASGYGLIDQNGRFVIAPQCDDVEWDSTNNVAIVTTGGQSGLYSREGEPLTGLIYDQVLPGSDGMFPVRKDGKYGFIRRDGVMAIRPRFDDAFGFRDGFARVSNGNRRFLIDREGRLIDDIRQKTVTEKAI